MPASSPTQISLELQVHNAYVLRGDDRLDVPDREIDPERTPRGENQPPPRGNCRHIHAQEVSDESPNGPYREEVDRLLQEFYEAWMQCYLLTNECQERGHCDGNDLLASRVRA